MSTYTIERHVINRTNSLVPHLSFTMKLDAWSWEEALKKVSNNLIVLFTEKRGKYNYFIYCKLSKGNT